MSETLSHWINGQAVAGQSGRFGDIYNPAIGEKIAEVPFASTGEVDSTRISRTALYWDVPFEKST